MQLRPCFTVLVLWGHLLFQGIRCFIKQLAQPISSSSCARVPLFKRKIIFSGFLMHSGNISHPQARSFFHSSFLPLYFELLYCTVDISKLCMKVWNIQTPQRRWDMSGFIFRRGELSSSLSTWQWLRQAWISHHVTKDGPVFTGSSLG